jgi:hypothetical protein
MVGQEKTVGENAPYIPLSRGAKFSPKALIHSVVFQSYTYSPLSRWGYSFERKHGLIDTPTGKRGIRGN